MGVLFLHSQISYEIWFKWLGAYRARKRITTEPDKTGLLEQRCQSYQLSLHSNAPFVCTSSHNERRAVGVVHQIVRELCRRYENTYRNVTLDKSFTSYELAQEMFTHRSFNRGNCQKKYKVFACGISSQSRMRSRNEFIRVSSANYN